MTGGHSLENPPPDKLGALEKSAKFLGLYVEPTAPPVREGLKGRVDACPSPCPRQRSPGWRSADRRQPGDAPGPERVAQRAGRPILLERLSSGIVHETVRRVISAALPARRPRRPPPTHHLESAPAFDPRGDGSESRATFSPTSANAFSKFFPLFFCPNLAEIASNSRYRRIGRNFLSGEPDNWSRHEPVVRSATSRRAPPDRRRPSVTGRCVEEFELAPGTRDCSRRFVLAPAVSPIGRSARGEPIRVGQWIEWSGSSLGQILLSC
jgi:hypothetical protein